MQWKKHRDYSQQKLMNKKEPSSKHTFAKIHYIMMFWFGFVDANIKDHMWHVGLMARLLAWLQFNVIVTECL